MSIQEYVAQKKAQLEKLERTLEERTHVAERLAPWRAKRDDVLKKLEAIAGETSERWDVLRMGVESAWAELEAAFETATSKDLNSKGTRKAHSARQRARPVG